MSQTLNFLPKFLEHRYHANFKIKRKSWIFLQKRMIAIERAERVREKSSINCEIIEEIELVVEELPSLLASAAKFPTG